MDPFLGEIRIFAGTFAPKDWAFCNGQLLPVRQYSALFSLLGITYGGNGTTTFALPNLQAAAPMGAGQGPGLTPRQNGDSGGEATHQITLQEMAPHAHGISCFGASGTLAVAKGNFPASSTQDRSTGISNDTPYGTAADATMNAAMILPAGGGGGADGQALVHNNMQPYLGIYYIISLAGVFPQRP